MKKFQCTYLTAQEEEIEKDWYTKIEAESPEEAASIFSSQCQGMYPFIVVTWGLTGVVRLDNPMYLLQCEEEKKHKQQEEERRLREEAEREKQQDAARLELLQKLLNSVETKEGGLAGLSYHQINALVENMQEFPGLAEGLNPEEYAVREKLYKVAFFDRNLQAGLQAQYAASQAQYAASQAKQASVQTDLLNKLNVAVGNSSSSGAVKGSNAAKNAALLGGAAALMKLNQISEDTADISEGFGFD